MTSKSKEKLAISRNSLGLHNLDLKLDQSEITFDFQVDSGPDEIFKSMSSKSGQFQVKPDLFRVFLIFYSQLLII